MTNEQAVAWKIGFGALVLAFSVVSLTLRKSTPPPVSMQPITVRVQMPAPAPEAQPPQRVAEIERPAMSEPPAPLDVQDEAPVRIEVTVPKPKSVRRPGRRPVVAVTEVRGTRAYPVRIHRVVATRRASPYAIGKRHYPYDPRDRWRSRELP